MKYLCLIYDQERDWDAMPPGEADAWLAECMAAEDALRAGGHHLAGEALHPAASASIVRVRKGRLSVTDGPFAETREQLGGFYLVEARDVEEAVRVAAMIPAARTGCIEVRPVVDFTAR
ncbi:YciI family protein [Longimicrobium sp.]|uniref:YciI family protein n=1 Tax=Longimicrobium sp. TaxID=2029185 RepID=UPI002E31A3EC|nr:YciI family protein [Longimicrobium sp.]HEX6041027.1 YciI family protein [Longimicrobium sp.]